MRLDFNETNILLQALSDMEKQYGTVITIPNLLDTLNLLLQNTDSKYIFICDSVKSLIRKTEGLSEESLRRILADKTEDKIIATARYALPVLFVSGKESIK